MKWFCAILLTVLACSAGAQSREYQIKAAFLFNFAQFVDWPPATFGTSNALFYIGILGHDPFGAALDQTIQDENIDNHKIVIERSERIEDLKNCQMIFVSKSEKGQIAKILSDLDSRPVLTVGDIDDFATQGGGINFFLAGTKVRFEINQGAVQSRGLKISSQLLSLGKIVESAKEGK